MLEEMLRADRLSLVISHATAPAFLLGAVAAFLAIILSRMEHLMGRMRLLIALQGGDASKAYPEKDVVRLRMRVSLLHRAVFYGLLSGISATVQVMISFLFGFANLTHVYGMGLLFLLTLGLLCLALSLFAREVRAALKDYERVG